MAIVLCHTELWSQGITKIRGTIYDARSQEPVMYANVAFEGTSVGTITSETGGFFLETRNALDTLTISCVGYETKRVPINKGVYQQIKIELEPGSIAIAAVTVKAGERQSTRIMRKVFARKKFNNPANLRYTCDCYNKLEIDINNVDEDLKARRLFNNFQFVWKYLDTNAITGKVYLPIFITETSSKLIYSKEPPVDQELVWATKMSGVDNQSVAQFTGQFYQDVNIYDNFIHVFNQGLISPISSLGMLHYNYALLDSTWIDGRWCYQISFKPKFKMEPTFVGDMWIHDSTFAVVKIQAQLAELVNLNYIKQLVASQQFTLINDSIWFPKTMSLFVDFNISDKTTGFFGHKTTSYSNVLINNSLPDSVLKSGSTVLVDENALEQDEAYWTEARPFELTERESNIYQMVDSVQNVPFYKTVVDVLNMLINSYYVIGYVELGPYYQTYSFNELEGHRFKLSARTSNKFSTNVMLSGFIAYGTKDQRLKYGGQALFMLDKNPRTMLSMLYKEDIEQLGQSPYSLTEDNIFTSLLRRNPNNKITMVREYSTYFQRHWTAGLSNTLKFSHRDIYPTSYIPFVTIADSMGLGRVSSTAITLNFRWQRHERYLEGEFERVSMGSNWPEVNFDIIKSLKVLGGDYDYWELKFNYYHKFNLSPFGYSRLIVDAGKIFGQVPYPLLRLHEGNETYALERYGFNMMNYYEFASDQYASLFLEHHFQGFFLNHIPLLRRLRLREVVSGKFLVGSISSANQNCLQFPTGLHRLTKPYMEIGVGIENILNIIRIDAIWRLTYTHHPDIQIFGIRAGLQFIF